MAQGPDALALGRDLSATAIAETRRRHAKARATALRSDTALIRDLRAGLSRVRRISPPVRKIPGTFWSGFRARQRKAEAAFDTTTLERLIDQEYYDDAVVLGAALLPRKSADRSFLSTARKGFAAAGEPSLQLDAVRAMRTISDSADLARQEAMLAGRIREIDAAWSPGAHARASAHPLRDPVAGRILHVLKASVPYRQSGYTMRSRYLIDSQRAAGLDPVVMTFPGFPERIGVADAPPVEVVGGTTYHRLRVADDELDGPPDAYLDAFVAAAAPLVEDIRPEVLHVHSGHRGYEGALATLALGRAFQIPVVYEVRGFFESLWSRNLTWNERGELYDRRYATETRCMNASAAVVTLSESMKSDIVARGVPAEKVVVMPNGVDVEAFHPGPRRIELVDALGLADSFVFGYVSNLDHFREGHEALILAAAELRRRGIRATALIVGDGGRRDELEDLARTSGAADAVVFTGRVPHDEVLDHYRLLDVFVVPRVDERAARLVTPLKPYEAMAAGIPVVVSDLPALQEVIGDGSRGWSFPQGDADALADVLEWLVGAPDVRATMGAQARDWVVAERTWSAVTARYADLYASVRGVGVGPPSSVS